MEPLILNTDFTSVAMLDVFESLIWVERYCGYGDFEIYAPASTKLLENVKLNRYLYLEDSDQVMIIESIDIKADVEDGSRMTVTGRSLESILDRRIVWTQTTLDGYLEGQVKKLLNENIINPSISARKVSNFIFEESKDSEIAKLKISAQFTGDNLYDVIVSICSLSGIGFRIRLTDDNKFAFSLYRGLDRSYNQTENPYITFSPKFDNLNSSNFYKSNLGYKNVSLIAGEGEGTDRKTVDIFLNGVDYQGIYRRELYVDARDISSTDGEETLTDEEYKSLLRQRGFEKLEEYKDVETFEGEADPLRMYIYGRDYFKGDIVQVSDEYGNEATTRITEFIRSQSVTGYTTYPTFELIE